MTVFQALYALTAVLAGMGAVILFLVVLEALLGRWARKRHPSWQAHDPWVDTWLAETYARKAADARQREEQR